MTDQIISCAASGLVGIAIGAILMDKLGQQRLSAEEAAQQEQLKRLYSDPDPVVGRASEPEAPKRKRVRPAQIETAAKRGPRRPRKTAA